MPRPSLLQPSILLSADDLAHLLCLSKRSVWRFHSADKLPKPIRLGRSVRWRRDEIEKWIAAGLPHRRDWEALSAKGASR